MPCLSPRNSNAGSRRKRAAFTLVEVALATGIASFTLVALIGMLPVGLSSQRQAISNTVESQIVQAVTNDVLLTNFSDLSAAYTKTYTFDNSGQTISTINAGAITVYTATVTLTSLDGSAVNPLTLQTGTSKLDQGYNVTIKVANVTTPQITHTYSVVLAQTTL